MKNHLCLQPYDPLQRHIMPFYLPGSPGLLYTDNYKESFRKKYPLLPSLQIHPLYSPGFPFLILKIHQNGQPSNR